MYIKGWQKKTYTFLKWLLRSQFVQYRYVTPTIRTEILSGFQIMLEIYCSFHTFCATLESILLGSVFKLPGRKKIQSPS